MPAQPELLKCVKSHIVLRPLMGPAKLMGH
jgi:hypothetical protein